MGAVVLSRCWGQGIACQQPAAGCLPRNCPLLKGAASPKLMPPPCRHEVSGGQKRTKAWHPWLRTSLKGHQPGTSPGAGGALSCRPVPPFPSPPPPAGFPLSTPCTSAPSGRILASVSRRIGSTGHLLHTRHQARQFVCTVSTNPHQIQKVDLTPLA